MEFTKTAKSAGTLLAYPLAFAYLKFFLLDFSGEYTVLKRVLFVAGFILLSMLVLSGRERKPTKATYFWYGVMGVVALTSVTGISEPVSMLGLHLCALYVAVLSCGLMYEGKTGSFIAADLFNAGMIKSFTGFPNLFSDAFSKKDPERKSNPATVASGIVGVIVMIPIFVVAVTLLRSINCSFDLSVRRLLKAVTDTVNLEWLVENIGYLLFAIPVSMYLYGMLTKCAGSSGEAEKKAYAKLVSWRGACRKVSEVLSAVVTGCFVVLYMVFFFFEGSYLFSAFAGKLPAEFTAAEYARKGFFELTGIMFINMLVYLLVTYFTKRDSVAKRVSSGMIIALMSESIVFAAVSFSKLALYYSRFGYTPKRLLAMWGTLIFAAGAVMVIVSILKKKDMSRAWIYFATGSFTLMNVLSSVIWLLR